jgi:GH25 family lysozyme M1 (1,4-beta-N-acetylmuramidase)
MTINEAKEKIVKLAKEQVGYVPYSGKKNKYAEYLDSLGDFYNTKKNGYDWCEIFFDYLFVKTFGVETGRKMLYQPKKSTGAGCGFSAQFYRENKAWSKVPQIGSQIYYGTQGNEYHTGLVYDVDDKYIYTIEGNTGGGNGKVGKKKFLKTTTGIAGYGIPNWNLVANTKTAFKQQWGIDISGWQGNFDLAQAVREGVKFVILKGGGGDDGLYKDNRFEENYKKAKALGIPVGVYWFSKALSESQAKIEAKYFYDNCLKGKQFELPIYIDVENRTQLAIGKRKLTDVIKAWLKTVRGYGYWVGIYSSMSYFNTYMYDDELSNYAHWIAQWSTSKPNYKPANAFGLWQFGGETNYIRSKYVAGQVVDQNYLMIDYEAQIKAKGLNGWKAGDNSQTKPVTPAPAPKPVKIAEDGNFGKNSVKALQKWLGTTQDGVISGQYSYLEQYYPALTSVEFDDGGSPCVRALQNFLVKKGYRITVDGIIGKSTVTALQKFLNTQGNKLTVDGIMGKNTATALQKYLNKVAK